MFGVRTIQKSPSAVSPEDKDKRSRTFLNSNSSISCASHHTSSYNNKSKSSINPALSKSFGARTKLSSASFGSSAVKKTQNMCAATTCCDICATLPFNVRALTDSDGGDSDEDHLLTLKKTDSDDDTEKKPCCVGFGGDITSKRLKRIIREIESKCDDGMIPDVARLSAKEVKTGKRVGKGGSASVYEVTSFNLLPTTSTTEENDNNVSLRQNLKEASAQKQEKYVLKRMSKNLLAPGGQEQSKFAHAAAVNMLLEAQFLRFMDHPNIVSLAALGECDSENLFLVMTCLPESMEQRISSWRKQVKRHRKKQLQYVNAPSFTKWSILCKAEQQKKQQFSAHLELRRLMYERLHVAKDVAAGVGYLHEQGILYRDLKTSNIGFDVEGKVKLFDFGISRFLPAPMQDGGDLEDSFAMSKVGTKMFMAPEIAEKKPYGLKADCYSFGVLLWQLLAMANPRPVFNAPFPDEDADSSSMAFNRIVSTNRSGPRFEFPLCACWPMFVQSLLRRILQRNPKLRPSMAEIERKLDGALEKLWKEIQQDEEAMFGATAPSSPTSVASVASLSPKKGVIPFLFGNDAYNRQKTAEMDYENEQF